MVEIKSNYALKRRFLAIWTPWMGKLVRGGEMDPFVTFSAETPKFYDNYTKPPEILSEL